MNALNLAENIIRLRHDKKITQEQLADFVGVTKASVSKWETKQSMPDILLLPQLAAFFDVTIDELLGYEPQLSKEQMQKIYLELASDFFSRFSNGSWNWRCILCSLSVKYAARCKGISSKLSDGGIRFAVRCWRSGGL